MPPFVIFALPRSRTAWLANFLSGGGAPKRCGHDLGAFVGRLSEVETALTETFSGTVETGAMGGWRWLRHKMPEARFFTVRRPYGEVANSLGRLGLPVAHHVLALRDALLDEIDAQYGTRALRVEELDDPAVCADLFRECHGFLPPVEWVAQCMAVNLQINMRQRVAWLAQRADVIEQVKAEAALADRELAARHLPFVQFGVEPWEAIRDDAVALGEAHFAEVEHNVEPRRRFKVNDRIMQAMSDAGLLVAYTARVDGRLAGYCSWTITDDPESEGLLVANHGPWFVEDRPEYRPLRLGVTMFRRSLDVLKARGVQCVFPHHRLEGRGVNLGAFYKRLGAKEIQRNYILWIGD